MKNCSISKHSIHDWVQDWASLQSDLTLHSFDELESTNTFARNLQDSPKNQLVITKIQTAGRGRGSNTWISPEKDTSLLSSWVFDLDGYLQPILSPLVGLSVYEALHEIRGFSNISLKAPNDIYINQKKVCGILIENQTQGSKTRCVIGIGINVFKSPNIPTAGCLNDFRSEEIDLCVWSAFLIELYRRLKDSVSFAKQSHLTPDQCLKLKRALSSSHPQLDKVLPDGSLVINGKTLTWSDL